MKRITAVSLSQPVVRMLVCFVQKDEDPAEPWIEPVLGIESSVIEFDGEYEVHREPIVLLDGQLDTVLNHCRFLDLASYVLVANWPAEEDTERLKPVLDGMRKRMKSRSKVTA